MTDYTDDYLAFYEAYPRSEGKQEGQKAWNGLTIGAKQAALADVEKRKRLGAYPSNKKLIQLPASYLRAARWDDDWRDTLESARKGDVDKPNSGLVSYVPRETGLPLTKWESLANRWLFRWLRAGGGVDDSEVNSLVAVKNACIAEMSGPLDQDLAADNSRESQTEAIWTFLNVLIDRLDLEFGRELKPLLLRGAELSDS